MLDDKQLGVPGRREYKYLIDYAAASIAKSRLSSVLDFDTHYNDGKYFIRSVYFDDYNDSAYNEKLSGVNERRKIRARYYNFDKDYIILEKKVKNGDLVQKKSSRITDILTDKLINNESIDPQSVSEPFFDELYYEMKADACSPVVIVDYDRTAWQVDSLNVRVTIDENIRATENVSDFFIQNTATFPVLPEYAVLEIKYDDYFPEYIIPLLSDLIHSHLSVSKYILCRDSIFGFKNR